MHNHENKSGTYTCRIPKISTPPTIEGDPTGPGWDQAARLELADCITGESPRLPTQCKLLWDRDFLYVGYEVSDSEIVATFATRDDPLYEEDVVELFLVPGPSRRYYYEFNFSSQAVIFDAVVLNDDGRAGVGRGNLIALKEWNCPGLQCRTTIQENHGWKVTVAIPFSELHFARNTPPQPGDKWGMNCCRIEYGLPETEYTAWSPPGLLDFHTTEKFGALIFTE